MKFKATTLIFASIAAFASTAQADDDEDDVHDDIAVGAKVTRFGGDGELFDRIDSSMGYGLELYFNISPVSLLAEGLFLKNDRYRVDLHLGKEIVFGGDQRLSIGLFSGFLALIDQERESDKETTDRIGLAWNLVRARIAFEVFLFDQFSIAAEASAGYHIKISGKDVAEVVQHNLDDTDSEEPDSETFLQQFQSDMNDKAQDSDDSGHLNFTAGISLRYHL